MDDFDVTVKVRVVALRPDKDTADQMKQAAQVGAASLADALGNQTIYLPYGLAALRRQGIAATVESVSVVKR